MRRLDFSLALTAALVLGGCGTTAPDTRPQWLLDLIAQLESAPVTNPPASIVLQEYAAGVFYYMPGPCCDQYSNLYDAEGTLVCHPDGGITGGGDGSCPALGEPMREEIVWRDTRTP